MAKKNSYHDLKELLDLKEGEIDELNLEINQKDEKIAKYSSHITKLKHQNELLEIKINNEINNEKAKIKELDDLAKKIKEKEEIIDDKQEQVKYLRELINDYRQQIKDTIENLEVQLHKISKTYENLLNQKDKIIEKQDQSINELNKSIEEIRKSNKTNFINLDLQNKKYQKIIDEMQK